MRAIGEESQLEGLADEAVLELSVIEGRILVTADVVDFPPLLREWTGGGRSHAGCILIYGIGHREFGLVLRGLRAILARRSRQPEWIDRVEALTRSAAR